MKKLLNKKAFTLVEIVVAIGILAAASVGIGAIVVAVQNNSQKQFQQGDLQQQLSNVQESLKNDLLTTNAGVKYWIQDEIGTFVESDGANKNPDRSKIVAMYNMDYIDNTLTKTYVKYDADTDILYKAEFSDTVVFDQSKKMLLDESPDDVTNNSNLEWYVYAQGITNFSMDLSKYAENQTINYNVNINSDNNDFESDNTVNVRNEIPINDATILENYDQAVVAYPALKNTSFVYNGQEQSPKQLDVNSRYVEIRITDPEQDRISATNVGTYRITYHLKNAIWADGTTDDYTLEWQIIPREIIVEWLTWTWVYDGQPHTAEYHLSNVIPSDLTQGAVVELHNGTLDGQYGTKTATLVVKNPNYTIKENQEKEISITKGVAEFTVLPQPAGTADSPLVYNGQAQPLVIPGSTGCGTIYYSLSANSGFSTSVPTAISANGETPYIVYYYIEGTGSYANSEKRYMEVVMKRAIPAIQKPIAFDGVNYVTNYDGSVKNLLYFAGSTSAATAQETNFLYSLDGNTYSTELPTGVSANMKYTVWYKSKETDNFQETIPQYVEAVISKTERPSDSFTLPTPNNTTYNGAMQSLFIPGTGHATQAAGWMYKLADGEWSTAIPQKDAAGNYEVYLKLPETADYAEYVLETPVVVTIDKAVAQYKLNSVPSALPYLTYSGQPQSLVKHGLTSDGIIHYAIGPTVDSPNKDAFSDKIPQGTSAGEYYVFCYIKGDSNHYDSDIMLINAKIAPTEPQIAAKPVALNAQYNGTDQLLITTQGISDNGTPLVYSLSDEGNSWSEIPPSATNAGTYTVYYKVPANDNYGESEVNSVIATIAQAETKITGPQGINGLVYNGTLQELCYVGETEFGEFEYSVNSQQQWTYNIPSAINAGRYEIYWRVTETSNYKGAEGKITVVIQQQTLDYTPPEASQLVYNGESQALVVLDSGSVADGYHFEYREFDPAAAWSELPPYRIDAGTYYVEYRIVADDDTVGDNIEAPQDKIIAVISPAIPTINVQPVSGLVFNESLQDLIDMDNTTIDIGELEFATDPDGPYSSYAWAQDAGQYTVFWRTKESDNIIPQSGIVPVTIAPMEVDYPTVTSLQLEYTGDFQFPEITVQSRYINVVEGLSSQKEVAPLGYEIIFELTSSNVTWKGGSTDNYIITWYITKGGALVFDAPVPTPQTFTGAPQLLFSSISIPPSSGTPYYRLAGFKGQNDSNWTNYTDSESPWQTAPPLCTNVGEYKFLYRIDSNNYESVPETEITSSITKGIMTVDITDMLHSYSGELKRPAIEVDTLGVPTSLSETEWILDEKGNPVIQKRIIVEVSKDNGKTWAPYYLTSDPRYATDSSYKGETAPGAYTLQVRITDELGEYETYLNTNITLVIQEAEANWIGTHETPMITYTGSEQALLRDNIIKTGMHFEYQVADATEKDAGWTYGKFSTRSTDIPNKINAGTYAVKVFAVAEENYKIYPADGSAPISEQEVDIIHITIQKKPIEILSTPYLKNEILYYKSGTSQSLGLVNGTLAEDYGDSHFVYFVNYYKTPESEPTVFTQSGKVEKIDGMNVFPAKHVDSGYPKPTNKGIYTIEWWVQGDSNHENYYHSVNGTPQSTLTAQIVAPDDITQLTGLNLAYTGALQQIFILPYTSYSSNNIFLSTDGVTWTNDASEIYNLIHKTDVGDYTIYWKKTEKGEVQGPVQASISRGTLDVNAFRTFASNHSFAQIIFSTTHSVNGLLSGSDISVEQNGSIYAWLVEDTLFIASSAVGEKVIAPVDCSNLLADLPQAIAVDVSGLDTSNTKNMSNMFYGFGQNVTDADVHFVGLSSLVTNKVTNAAHMFENAASSTSAVYAPGLMNIVFATNVDKTDWLKNFGANAVIKEIGTPEGSGTTEHGDVVSLENNIVSMFAGSVQEQTLIAANWTATYNGTAIEITQTDYLHCETPYIGDGTYEFTGVLKTIDGAMIEIAVTSDVVAAYDAVTAEILIEEDILTMYVSSLENKGIVTGQWTVEHQEVPMDAANVTIVHALEVQIPIIGEGVYRFKGILTNENGIPQKVVIDVTVGHKYICDMEEHSHGTDCHETCDKQEHVHRDTCMIFEVVE